MFPIPHIMSHALADSNAETRKTLELFEQLVARLESAIKGRLSFNHCVPLEFPQIAASYLLSSLQRVRVTSWGVITALNAPNEVLFVMSVRALLESAANIAYLQGKMQSTYDGEFSRKDMTYLSLRMKFATRKPEDMDLDAKETKLVASVNVLTAIKALDRFAADQLGFVNQSAISAWYERLCEFSHPNCLGNSIGSELEFSAGFETFDVDPVLRQSVLALFANYVYVSLYAFCLLYNDCWRLLVDAGEALPAWEPSGEPLVRLDQGFQSLDPQ